MVFKFKVYIIHDTNLESRKLNVEHLVSSLSELKNVHSVTIVKEYDSKSINYSSIKNLIRTKKPEHKDGVEELFEKFQKPLVISNISNYLKHFSALEKISKSDMPGLIIEDDVITSESMKDELEKFENLPHECLFFGQPFKNIPKDRFSEMRNYHDMALLPSCESYLISQRAAKKIIEKDFIPIAYQTNIGLSVAINRNSIPCYKMYPNIFVDGSKTGKFTSSINPNNVLTFNSKYNILYSLIQEPVIDENKFNEEFERTENNTSPDLIYLKGLCLLKCNKIKESKEKFDEAFDKYCDDNCQLNKTSSFMANYLKFFKVLQPLPAT